MSLQYGPLYDSDDDITPEPLLSANHQLTPTESRHAQLVAYKWPKTIGIAQMFFGFVLGMLGAAELLIIPLVEPYGGVNFSRRNCYGAGIWAGFVMIITGSTALRSSISKRQTTLSRFFVLTVISLCLNSVITIVLIVGYAEGWTSKREYPAGSSLYEVHIFITICAILGTLFCLAAFIQYFEELCCGDAQLFKKWVECCCPTIYKISTKHTTISHQGHREMPIGPI